MDSQFEKQLNLMQYAYQQREIERFIPVVYPAPPTKENCHDTWKRKDDKDKILIRRETVAEHTAMVCWCIMVFNDYIDDGIDRWELTQASLLHDIGEVLTWDKFYLSKTDKDRAEEMQAIAKILREWEELQQLWLKWSDKSTHVGRTLKQLDILAALLGHVFSGGVGYLEQGTTAAKETLFSEKYWMGSESLGDIIGKVLLYMVRHNFFCIEGWSEQELSAKIALFQKNRELQI